MAGKINGPHGEESFKQLHQVQEKQQPIPEPIKAQFNILGQQIKALKQAVTPMGLPAEKVALSFHALDRLMSIRGTLKDENLNELQATAISMRVYDLVSETLDLYSITEKAGGKLSNEMKSFIFTLMYDLANQAGRDSAGNKELITDIVGQESSVPLSDVLEDAFNQYPGMSEHLQEALTFAFNAYPLVLLALYMHKDSPLPSTEKISKLAQQDGRNFTTEYARHFEVLRDQNPEKWQSTHRTWSQLFSGGVELIWRKRSSDHQTNP